MWGLIACRNAGSFFEWMLIPHRITENPFLYRGLRSARHMPRSPLLGLCYETATSNQKATSWFLRTCCTAGIHLASHRMPRLSWSIGNGSGRNTSTKRTTRSSSVSFQTSWS